MGRLAVVLAVVVAACQPHGLLVEVQGSNVELFIASGDAPCSQGDTVQMCPIVPPDLANPLAPGTAHLAKRWLLDTDLPISKEVSGSTTRFMLETDGKADQTIPALLAVQFTDLGGSATVTRFALLHDVVVRHDRQERVIVTLAEAGSLGQGSASTERLQVWRRPADMGTPMPGTAPCVLVAHPAGTDRPFESFSPPTDTDCDQTEPHECNSFASYATVDATAMTCLPPSPTIANVCRIGGNACTDGKGTSAACTATRELYCMPYGFCDGWTASGCQSFGDACSTTTLVTKAAVAPSVRCTYEFDQSGAPCTTTTTVVDMTTITTTGPVPATCKDVKIAANAAPLKFNGAANLGTGDVMVALDPAGTCAVDLMPAPPASPTSELVGLIDLQVMPTGGTSTMLQHRVLPIIITGHQGAACGPFTCQPIATPQLGDGLVDCR